jgi:hypothetical protein
VRAAARNVQSLVGVLSDEPDAVIGALRSLDLGARPTPDAVTLSSAELPDTEPLLRAFNLIVIDDYSTDLLTASQRRALVDYVAMGGNLLLGSGVAWHRVLSGIDPSLLPMQPTGTEIVPMDVAIPGVQPAPRPTPTAIASPVPSPTPEPPMQVEIATAGAISGSAWLSEYGNPLLLEKAIGAGGVGMSTFDWAAAPIVTWHNATPLLRMAASRLLLGQPQTVRTIGGQTTWVFGSAPQVPEHSQSDPIASAVITLPERDLPSVPLTALFVVLYAALIYPVNYYLLRAIGRLELAWVTLPVVALVFIGGIYVTGLGSKARSVQRNEITIVYTQPGWSRSLHVTYGAVFAPSAGDYHAQISPSGLVAPLDGGAGNGDVQVRPQDDVVDTVNAGAFSMHGYVGESIQPSPAITAVATYFKGALSVHVHNGSGASLSGGYVVAGSSTGAVPDLGPGANADVVLQSPTFVGQTAPQVYPGSSPYYYGSAPATAEQIEGNERNAVLSMMLTINQSGSSLAAPTAPVGPVFVGWSTLPEGPQSVNGSTPVTRSETAYVVPIAISPLPPGALPQGMVKARMVQAPVLGGSITPGATGGGSTASSVYEIVVPVNDAFPHRIAIGYTIPVPEGGAEYWDWSSGTWVIAPEAPFSLGSLPISAMDPASRIVRFRLALPLSFSANALNGIWLGGVY